MWYFNKTYCIVLKQLNNTSPIESHLFIFDGRDNEDDKQGLDDAGTWEHLEGWIGDPVKSNANSHKT
jgi:hypothetical protein